MSNNILYRKTIFQINHVNRFFNKYQNEIKRYKHSEEHLLFCGFHAFFFLFCFVVVILLHF